MADRAAPHASPALRGAVTRRGFLAGAAAAAATVLPGAVAVARPRRPLALVYRGPASVPGCPEAVARLLENGPTRFRVQYCGPDESRPLSRRALADAALYAQPGGGSIAQAWPHLEEHARTVRRFVADGGAYLGFCLGAYLASPQWGFGVFEGSAVRYINTPGSSVHDTSDAIVDVTWRGEHKTMYFQDGPQFAPDDPSAATVLARYDTGAVAALVAPYGAGAVGLTGPHPEADRWWYPPGLVNPQGIDFSMGYDLVSTTWNAVS